MSKIVCYTLMGAVMVVLIGPVASAQDKSDAVLDTFPTYYTSSAADLTIKPGTGGGWQNIFPKAIIAGDSLWFGTQNAYRPNNRKLYWLELKDTTVAANPIAVQARGYKNATTQVYFVSNITSDTVSGGVKFHVFFKPQPEWEVILVKNNTLAPMQITSAVGTSDCVKFLPALTNWGLIILLALLILSGIIVIRQRRRGVVRA
jgi:hypothetical protein